MTIDIVENSSSSLDANTKTGKSSSMSAGVPNLFGLMRTWENHNDGLNRDLSGSISDTMVSGKFKNDFKGNGSSDRKGSITASLGGRIVEVLPNGNLVIVGTREMKVNNESQVITVTGVARREDIDPDNRIKSTYLADARIAYYGKGVLADSQKPGWLTRLLSGIWPF